MTIATTLRRSAELLPGLLFGSAAVAHPGHDTAPAVGLFEGLVHQLTQPDHLGLLALAVGAGVISVRAVRAKRSERC